MIGTRIITCGTEMAFCATVFAGIANSSISVLFAAVAALDPLFTKNRISPRILVPKWIAVTRSIRPPFVASAVNTSAVVPVPSVAVFAPSPEATH